MCAPTGDLLTSAATTVVTDVIGMSADDESKAAVGVGFLAVGVALIYTPVGIPLIVEGVRTLCRGK